jgi:hypothetical protein
LFAPQPIAIDAGDSGRLALFIFIMCILLYYMYISIDYIYIAIRYIMKNNENDCPSTFAEMKGPHQ